jgi:steroid 5-alpha reductase family enzyme
VVRVVPLQVAMYERADLSAVTWLGVAVWAVGFGFETVGIRSCAGSGPIRHTGKKLLEKHMARSKGAAYADYVRRTSGFIPWPPR